VIDQDASSLWIRTHRAGLLSFLGHEHAIIPLDWSATVCAADPVPASAHGSVMIRTGSLEIDSDAARALAGLGDGPGEDDRAELSANLLGPDGLDAEAHPDIELRVDSVAPDDDGAFEGFARLTVRGVTRDIPIALEEVQSSPDGRLTLAGRTTVRQRDFGIEPESVAGVVKVADEVDLHMRLVAAATEGACEPGSPQIEPARATPDAHPHRSAFVEHDGARLHYLEWSGDGPVVVLLPGYALTAHAFDEVGGLLADQFRVVAATPRGFGESDAPDSSDYTIATMVADLGALLDSLGIERAALVGHSISGSTISEFARAHPGRVTKLVFLDAFPYFAEAGGDSIDALSPVSGDAFAGEMTYPRLREFLSRYRFGGWSPALEADLRANTLGPDLMRRRTLTDGYVRDQRRNPTNLASLSIPALQLCAIPTTGTEYPWLRSGTAEHAKAAEYVEEVLLPFNRRLCSRFSTLVPTGTTLEVTGSHYVFFLDPSSTAQAIGRFLLEK
jgi:pimeloyl-ACP methyl ester carboxylesterase